MESMEKLHSNNKNSFQGHGRTVTARRSRSSESKINIPVVISNKSMNVRLDSHVIDRSQEQKDCCP